MNPKLIKNHFEKSFKTYNENAIVQRIMAENLIKEILKIQKDFKNILELGSGTGLLTQFVKENISFEKYFSNDLSEKSKNYVKAIIPNTVFYCGNALKIKPSCKMDLIISNAMFQWFKNLEKVAVYYNNVLNKGGILAFTTFSPENFKEIRELTNLSLDYKTVDEIKNIFNKNFEIIYINEFTHTLDFANPLELLAHMKNTGVNSISEKLWTFKEVKDFCNNYREKFPNITLTYTPITVICKKL